MSATQNDAPALIDDEDFAAFVVALDRRTWPDGELVVSLTKRQLQAVREALEETLPALRARWAEELAAKGLAVVPVAETREEWGAQRAERWGSTVMGPMWKPEARVAVAESPGDLTGVVRRTLYVGPWEPVDDA